MPEFSDFKVALRLYNKNILVGLMMFVEQIDLWNTIQGIKTVLGWFIS